LIFSKITGDGVEASILLVQQYAIPPSQPGGTRAFEFAKILEELGWRVRIFASDFSHLEHLFYRRESKDRRRRINIVEDGIRFSYSWVPPYSENSWRRIISMMWFSVVAFREVVLSPEEIIYASSPHIFGVAGSCLAAKIRRKRFVFEVRDLWPESYDAVVPGASNSYLYKLISRMANWLYRSADLIVIFTEGNRSSAIERGANPEFIQLLDGVDVKSYPIRDRRHSSTEIFKFVYIGSHGAAQGLNVVIDACKILESEIGPKFRVEFIGNGAEKSKLRQQADALQLSCVTFTNAIPKDEVARYLQEHDAGLLTLVHAQVFTDGTSPQKLYDYMAVGLPVVSNVQGGIKELIHVANAGLTSQDSTADALAKAMNQIMRDLAESRNEFDGGRQYLEEHVNRRTMSCELELRLRSLI